MTLQDVAIEQIVLGAGRACVRPPYSDGSVEVTVPSGKTVLVSSDGRETARPFNHSIDWSE